MKTAKKWLQRIASIASCFLVVFGAAAAGAESSPRLIISADNGWKFQLGDVAGAESPGYADRGWRTVDLPHDWSIEGKPQKDAPSGAGGGFFPTGIAWYRKTFQVPQAWAGREVSVEFDGVYRDSTVYLNGKKLITKPYGYSSFSLDLASGLKPGKANTLAVRVDNSAQPNSRWYSGSGIYRHVRMVVTGPIRVAHWGVFVTTPQVSANSASVKLQANVMNDSAQPEDLVVTTTFYDALGKKAASVDSPVKLAPGRQYEVVQQATVVHPALWSPATPSLYRAITQVRRSGGLVDEVTTSFGIRSLEWSAEKGLLLNGKAIKLTGGSVHHDNGPLGAAAFDRAEERRVELLKAAGHNAVRTAHNIPSAAFLDACDRLGLLVLDEPFDVWEAHKVKFDYGSDFDANWKTDVSAMVLRDRNHPSIVIWGIGNEIPELTVDKGAPLAKQLVAQVRALDTTRPLTLAFPGTTTQPTAQSVFSQLDITGYNYSLEKTYAQDHQLLPSRLMVTTESFPAKAFQLWEISKDNAYVLGDFTWTAMDYLGESGIGAWSYGTPEQAKMATMMANVMMTTSTVDKMFNGMANGVDMTAAMSAQGGDPQVKEIMALIMQGYPWHAADCGDIDLTGFRKPQSYYRDIVWNGGDRVYMTVRLPEPEGKKIIATGWATFPTLPSWSWPGSEGKPLQVEVYSGVEQVRLYLNGKVVGESKTSRAEEFKATFSVPYAPGELKVVGLRGGRAVAESVLKTAGPAKTLRLTVDRSSLRADGQDLAFVVVEAVDAKGQLVQDSNEEVTFTLAGPGTIAAVGNGDGQDGASYQGTHRKLFHGRAEVILRVGRQSGKLQLNAQAEKLGGASVALQTSAPASLMDLQ